ALRSSALVGMQPQLRQTPPARSSSTATTDSPSCAHRIAATYRPGPVPTTTTSTFCAAIVGLDQETQRLFEEALDVLEEARAHRAVHHAVVAGERQHHAAAHPEPALLDDGHAPHGAHGEDGALGRVDDRGEFRDVVHAEVRDRERRARHLLRAQLAVPCALREIARLDRDLAQALRMAV